MGRIVKDISSRGAYFYSGDRWCVGTILTLALQPDGPSDGEAGAGSSITVRCRVVRLDAKGIGVSFMLNTKKERQALEKFLAKTVPGKPSKHPLRAAEGQSLVELALLVPLVFLLIVLAVNFGGFIYAWITVADAARAGAQYAAFGGASATLPTPPTVLAIQTLVQNETLSLPGASSTNPTTTVCQNNSGTVTLYRSTSACPVTGTGPPTDPEIAAGTSYYTTIAVDVTYNFTPFIQVFSFPALRIGLPGMPPTIHRRTVMRQLN